MSHRYRSTIAPVVLLALVACQSGEAGSEAAAASTTPDSATVRSGAATPAAPATSAPRDSATLARVPNELGRIPLMEYHLIGDKEGRYERSRERFRQDLEILYRRGYRPVTIAQILDRDLNLPRGLSPVVIVFDDASPGQFKYIERDGKLEIDPESGIGILLDFNRRYPDWENKAVFCTLSGAAAGRSFFGEKDIEGQKSEWRFQKVRFLAEKGFELCNHTLWHARLDRYPDEVVQEQIARGQLAIDSAVPGYKVRSFALPLGIWPKNRELARRGSWTDPKTGRVVRYDNEAILEVSGGPTRSPHDPQFNPLSMTRTEVFGEELERTLDRLDRTGTRYVSDGDPNTVARPQQGN
ncbi:hypothetical protein BH23GEM2_BH23GEM2_12780 [soil metagenome]